MRCKCRMSCMVYTGCMGGREMSDKLACGRCYASAVIGSCTRSKSSLVLYLYLRMAFKNPSLAVLASCLDRCSSSTKIFGNRSKAMYASNPVACRRSVCIWLMVNVCTISRLGVLCRMSMLSSQYGMFMSSFHISHPNFRRKARNSMIEFLTTT